MISFIGHSYQEMEIPLLFWKSLLEPMFNVDRFIDAIITTAKSQGFNSLAPGRFEWKFR